MIEIHVEGMSCSGCVASVKRALESLDPASQVVVDLDSGRVSIASQTIEREQAIDAIEAAGYEVSG